MTLLETVRPHSGLYELFEFFSNIICELRAPLRNRTVDLLLTMDVVLGMVPAIVLAAGMFAWFALWWFVLPLRSRFRHLSADDRQPNGDG